LVWSKLWSSTGKKKCELTGIKTLPLVYACHWTHRHLSANLRSATADLNPVCDVGEILDVKLRISYARYGGLSQGRSYGGATGAAVPGKRVQGAAE
jgi:hypothetical protein